MNKKWLIATIVAGMAVTGSAGVYAGSKLQQIKAYLNHGLGIVVDGTPYWLKDANGKTLAPITYEGTTYLPIRSIADALDVPVAYDAVNSKVRIGSGAETGAASGSTGSSGSTGGTAGSGNSGSGTSTPAAGVKRPANLPKDFPIPADAVVTTTLDTDSGGVMKASFTYMTQETLATMGFVYSEYARIKRSENASETVTATTVKITGKLGGISPVSISGRPSTAQPGYNVFTVTWSEI
ncbi:MULTISPECIES: hypothetical protein [unclassified Paenibacillus]|uniref:hypothetical protein n=1 Tax=unclassified Paenibacillus TaxID=185978 RepID=UPI0030F607F9